MEVRGYKCIAMEFDHYQKEALRYAKYPDIGNTFVFPVLALTEEAGEIAGKVKKLMRDKAVFTPAQLSQEDTEALVKEMGDVLWYLAALAKELGVGLDTVAQKNLEKIEGRHERGTLQGSGDNR